MGSVLGSYRILAELSTGGMGTVYRAEHVLLERPAAVKLLRPDLTANAALVQRFFHEAKAVTACKHPGIVEVYDFDYAPDGRAFFVMELLEGEPLARRLARTRLAEAEVTVFAHGIASALKAAHRVGVIHRDLKPDNVFLVPDPDGGPDRTKVLDFGIAKLANPSRSARGNTQTGTLIGTPLYMAPEQARAAGAIDHRADLYSLGCILYHMLTGRPPFVGDGGGEIIALQMFAQVEPPSQHAPVTPEMEQLVLRLLEKDPADRFQNAGELVLALVALDPRLARSWPGTASTNEVTAATGGAAAQRPSDAMTTEETRGRRSRMPILAAAIAAIVAIGVGLVVTLRGDGAPAQLVPASSAVKAGATTSTGATTPAGAATAEPASTRSPAPASGGVSPTNTSPPAVTGGVSPHPASGDTSLETAAGSSASTANRPPATAPSDDATAKRVGRKADRSAGRGESENAAKAENAGNAGAVENASKAGRVETASKPGHAESASKPGHAASASKPGHAESASKAGHAESASKAGNAESASKAGNAESAGKTGDRDKAIEIIHELRQADPPRPGEHSNDGSPIESDVKFGRKRKDPSTP